MILSDARLRLLRLVDDAAQVRFPTDQILDDALSMGQQMAWGAVVSANRPMFQQETSITTSVAGVADLTTIKPVWPLGPVSQNINGWRMKISPGRLDDGVQNALIAQPLLINYVARAIFPTAAGNAFVWGSALITQTAMMDALMLACAACELTVTVGALNAALEAQREKLMESVAAQLSGTGWSIIPLDSLTESGAPESFYQYVMTAPDTLQLVVRRW